MIPFDDEYNEMARRTNAEYAQELRPLAEKYKKLVEAGDYESAIRVWLYELQPLMNKGHAIFEENMAWIEGHNQENPSELTPRVGSVLAKARKFMRRISGS